MTEYVTGSSALNSPRSWRELANIEKPERRNGFSRISSFGIGQALSKYLSARLTQNLLATTQFGSKVGKFSPSCTKSRLTYIVRQPRIWEDYNSGSSH